MKEAAVQDGSSPVISSNLMHIFEKDLFTSIKNI
jgi:hypothetical protein